MRNEEVFFLFIFFLFSHSMSGGYIGASTNPDHSLPGPLGGSAPNRIFLYPRLEPEITPFHHNYYNTRKLIIKNNFIPFFFLQNFANIISVLVIHRVYTGNTIPPSLTRDDVVYEITLGRKCYTVK